MLIPQVQRLVARGPSPLPDDVIVDVGSIARWEYDQSPTEAHAGSAVWTVLAKMAERTHRRLLWVVAMPIHQTANLGSLELSRIADWLEATVPSVSLIRSAEPLAGLLFGCWDFVRDVGVVTADIDWFPYQLALMERPAGSGSPNRI